MTSSGTTYGVKLLKASPPPKPQSADFAQIARTGTLPCTRLVQSAPLPFPSLTMGISLRGTQQRVRQHLAGSPTTPRPGLAQALSRKKSMRVCSGVPYDNAPAATFNACSPWELLQMLQVSNASSGTAGMSTGSSQSTPFAWKLCSGRVAPCLSTPPGGGPATCQAHTTTYPCTQKVCATWASNGSTNVTDSQSCRLAWPQLPGSSLR